MRDQLGNRIRSGLLLVAMGALLALVGWTLGGEVGVWVALGGAALMAWLSPAGSGWLSARGARALTLAEAPWLHAAVQTLAERAGIPTPRLALLPIPGPQALATGEGRDATIAVSPSLLRMLPPDEVVAVVAHEMSHLRHGDLTLLRLSETVRRTTATMSTFGLILLVLNLPLVLFGGASLPWIGVALLLFAPRVVSLLSLALSRAREHGADAGAVELTGDPLALARALRRIEAAHRGPWWARMFTIEPPASWRSHPPTEQRVARLARVAQRPSMAPPAPGPRRQVVEPVWVRGGRRVRAPRRFIVG